MRLLFVAGPDPSDIYAVAPLATAARAAGHQVLMSTPKELTPVVTGVGLPTVATTTTPIPDIRATRRSGEREVVPDDVDHPEFIRYTGRWFGRLAAETLVRLREVAAAWRPDVVVTGPHAYAGALLAHELSVPWIRHTWTVLDTVGIHVGSEGELAPELAELGLDRIPGPDLLIDNCPPGIRPADASPAQQIRHVPVNAQCPAEPWMYTRGKRRRVCVTGGRTAALDDDLELIRGMVRQLAEWDAEVVIPAPRKVAHALRAEFGDIRAGRIPLDVLLPTCDLIVHHAGGVPGLTGLTAALSGVPQLLMPQEKKARTAARLVAEYGAAVTLLPDEVSTDSVGKGIRELFSAPTYADRAQALAQEIARMPSPAEVLGTVEHLARR
ncbi:nucleotide disphospho-sugar-binding domain-containing protein [Streptomyces chattanoogensis]|uniref:nucleotide disphospho-sugar-binding domain-containing protein n=1 Tax=Streptomyces chattanoogensis TaxID=66876 RepID=UPI0036B52BA4